MSAPPPTLAQLEAVAAEHLRRVAREIVAPGFGGPPSSHRWTTSTQVHTREDELAGAALAASFSASFPGHALVIEDREPVPGDGVHEWFLDPIDGSANHLRGIPYVALSAGLRVDGEPVVGVVHDLVRDITVSAHAGGGARRHNGTTSTALHVAPTARLSEAMAIVHLSRRGPLMGRPGALARLLWSVRKIRCMGSIALDLALVAGGEADLLVAGRGGPQRLLDVLGGLVVLKEAGGLAVTADGRPPDAASRTLVAGPEHLCREFASVMAEHQLEAWHGDEAAPP